MYNADKKATQMGNKRCVLYSWSVNINLIIYGQQTVNIRV